MKSAEIREAFLRFFEKHQHQRVDSSSLIPANDPTLLFTNAGMVQFKEMFLGQEQCDYVRACSSQRCVRAGGKHNDLENVGYTARHHTFFEMLGNFSFGDYFKRDAIKLAWQFLTQELGLPAEKLWITVHVDDAEAETIWLQEVGVSPQRFSKLDEDNFWQMGDTGPCGPSSEIFYDHGEGVFGDPPGGPNDDGDRYIEIWNLVFMQFERLADGRMQALPNPSIDTGMGLERITAVMQGVHNNYDIDLFQELLRDIAALCNTQEVSNQSLRVIADHIRSCSFLIVDGVIPGNEGRAYVLRRIIRRAIRHGHKLNAPENFFHQLVPALVKQMGDAYPELKEKQAYVEKVLLAEEQQFSKTLAQGMQILESAISQLQGDEIPGDVIFKLYDSHGFPVDLVNDIARERDLRLDLAGYEAAMTEQRKRSSANAHFSADVSQQINVDGGVDFIGYQQMQGQASVKQILLDEQSVPSIAAGQHACLVLDKTPFYAESGGQVGDTGFLRGSGIEFEVHNTTKVSGQHLHWGVLRQGEIAVSTQLTASIDQSVRQAIALNHSATHLLHAALRQVLGNHVEQKGSLVDAQKLRFDFSHFEALSQSQLDAIEALVNQYIRGNYPVETIQTSMEQAKAMGAIALFGEKYGDDVRVLSMGEGFSVELCGGTHVRHTGDIALMLIDSESGVAAGVRRIEAVTGLTAFEQLTQWRSDLHHVAELVKSPREKLIEKVSHLLRQSREQEKQLQQLKQTLASAQGADLMSQVKELNGVRVLVAQLDDVERKVMLAMVDDLKSRLEQGVIFLAGTEAGQVNLVAAVTRSLTEKYKAGDLMKYISAQLGGKGGGRADLAQGAAQHTQDLSKALASVYDWVDSI